MDSLGSLATLYSFGAGNDGANPAAGLVEGSDGTFFGMTTTGGASGMGTIFRISVSGGLRPLQFAQDKARIPSPDSLRTALESFTEPRGRADRQTPVNCLSDCIAGSLKTLHSFTDSGKHPMAGLVQGGD